MSKQAKCELCGEPMPLGEEMFKFHGYSGHCPKPPLERPKPFHDRVEDKSRELYGLWKEIANDLQLSDEAIAHHERFREFCKCVSELGALLNMNVN